MGEIIDEEPGCTCGGEPGDYHSVVTTTQSGYTFEQAVKFERAQMAERLYGVLIEHLNVVGEGNPGIMAFGLAKLFFQE